MYAPVLANVTIIHNNSDMSYTQFCNELLELYPEGEFCVMNTSVNLYDVDWNAYRDTMFKISKIYPTVLFSVEVNENTMYGNYMYYIKNGKSHDVFAKLVYEAFDESQLQ